MSAIDLICAAFDQGHLAGDRDCPRSKCPYAPHTQAEKWQAWMLGYEEAAPRYRVVTSAESDEAQ